MLKGFQKKLSTFALLAALLCLLFPSVAGAARTDALWDYIQGGNYTMPNGSPSGTNILIYGLNHYLNFGTVTGVNGYGIRDNAGSIECKNSGGAWAACAGGGSGGSGTVTSVDVSGGTTGLSTTGGPVTTSGTITLTGTLLVANGGTGSTTLTGILKGNGTNGVQTAVANTDYQSPITLTTTGSSGAATFNGTTLNIPQYAGTTYAATYPVTLSGNAFGLAFGTSTSNTWGGTQTFTNTITGSISGNAATVTNGVYTTTFNGLFDNRLSASSSISGITTLPNLSLPYSQLTGTPTLFSYPFPGDATTTALTLGGLTITGKADGCATFASGVLNSTGSACGSGSGGSGGLASSTAGSGWTAGNVAVVRDNSSVYGQATSTPTVTSPLAYSGTLGSFVGGVSGAFSISQANGSTNGYLSSTDWSLFNNKISSSSLSAGAGISYNSSTGVITNTIGYPFTLATVFGTANANSTSTLTQFTAGIVASSTSRMEALALGTSTSVAYTNAPLVTAGNTNTYVQSVLANINSGNNASACNVLSNDLSTNTTYYAEFCLNSSGYTQAAFSSQNKNDTSITASDAGLVIGTASSSNPLADLRFVTGGTGSSTIRATITKNGLVGIGTTSPYALLSVHATSSNSAFTNTLFAIASSTSAATTTLFSIDNVGTIKTQIGSGLVLSTSGTLSAYAGTGACSANNFLTAVSSTGSPTCGSSTISGVALGSNLNSFSVGSDFTGTSYNGSAAVSDWALKMSQAHTWTALQQFSSNASTTQLSAGRAYFGTTATTTIDNTGNIVIPSASNLTITGKSDGCATFATGVLNSTGSACGGPSIDKWASSTLPGLGLYPNAGTGVSLGLGTTTPVGAQLVLASSTGSQLKLTDASATSIQWNVRNEGGTLAFATTSAAAPSSTTTPSAIEVSSNSSTLFGIATSSPWRTLSVTGTIGADGLSASAGTVVGLCLVSSTKEITANSGANCTVSSKRFKHDIEYNSLNGLEAIRQMKPVMFRYNDTNTQHIGFIAEDMQRVDPLLVGLDKTGLPSSVDDVGTIALAVEAIKEIDARGAVHYAQDRWQWFAMFLLTIVVYYQHRRITKLERSYEA